MVACAGSIKTSHDLDPDADFSKFRAYAWISEDPIINNNSGRVDLYVSAIDEKRIRTAVESELSKRGYRLTAPNVRHATARHLTRPQERFRSARATAVPG